MSDDGILNHIRETTAGTGRTRQRRRMKRAALIVAVACIATLLLFFAGYR